MELDITHFRRCITALEQALKFLYASDKNDITYEVYRSACIKEFEIIMELSGKLLRKILKQYFYSSSAADKLTFKDIFRHAVLRGIITDEESERWMQYRDNRNVTAHDYGVDFAEKTLKIIPQLIKDASQLCESIISHSLKEKSNDVDS